MNDQLRTKLQTLGLAGAFVLAGAAAVPATAQEATEPAEAAATEAVDAAAQVDDTTTVVEEDQGFDDWGLLGLLGLGGLAGLLRRDRPAVIDPTPTATRRTDR